MSSRTQRENWAGENLVTVEQALLGLGDGTMPRFVLLVVTVVLVAAGWGSSLRFVINPVASGDYALGVVCAAGGVAGIAALAGLSFLAHPWWMQHRHALASATEQDAPVRARIESLAYANHLPCPALLVDLRPRSAEDPSFRQGARIFGLPGRFTVAVGAGLRAVLRRAPERFDAVIAHEFGHIANRDVLITFLAVTTVGTFLSVSTVLLAWWSVDYLWVSRARWADGLAAGYDVYDMVIWDALSIARTLGRYLPFAILALLELALLIRAGEEPVAECRRRWQT